MLETLHCAQRHPAYGAQCPQVLLLWHLPETSQVLGCAMVGLGCHGMAELPTFGELLPHICCFREACTSLLSIQVSIRKLAPCHMTGK